MKKLVVVLVLLLVAACGGESRDRDGSTPPPAPTRAECEERLAMQPKPHTDAVRGAYFDCYLSAMRADPNNTEGGPGCECSIAALAMCFGADGLDTTCSGQLEDDVCEMQPGVATATTAAAANKAKCAFPDAWLTE